jgi:peptidoglycan/xylan/chitin deacetylase (PgdA/CDA1 family)
MEFARRLSRMLARRLPVKTASARAARAVASVTFDDFPKSAWTVGGPLMARYGARATYYTAGTFAGRIVDGITYYDTGDLTALRAAGHEIGCHGFAHEPVPSLSTAALRADVARNTQFLRGFNGGQAPVSYAFPFGDTTLRTKLFYARRFATTRGVHPAVNSGTLDLAQLGTIGIETCTWNEDHMARAIAQAKAARGWIVFHTHDVSDSPSPYGCTPAMLESVLKTLGSAGIEVVPMREAVRVATGEDA